MKIGAIGVSNLSTCFSEKQSSQRKRSLVMKMDDQSDSVSFKGIRAGVNGLLGGAAGLGIGVLLTAASGGLALPLILAGAGTAAGCIGGTAAEAARGEKTSTTSDDDDYHSYYNSHYD